MATSLLCRLGIKHHWRIMSAEDGGGRFYRCERCGKEKFPTPTGPVVG